MIKTTDRGTGDNLETNTTRLWDRYEIIRRKMYM